MKINVYQEQFLDKIKQMLQDNCLDCRHCKYAKYPCIDIDNCVCVYFGDDLRSQDDFCTNFEYNENMF